MRITSSPRIWYRSVAHVASPRDHPDSPGASKVGPEQTVEHEGVRWTTHLTLASTYYTEAIKSTRLND